MDRITCALALSVLLVLSSTPHALSQTATVPSGSGASGDPYLVSTLDNLYWITQNSESWSSFFKQTADIDASSSFAWDSGKGFSPIGNTSTTFTGTYDGDGHMITGLTIARSDSNYVGLFGDADNAKLKNIRLVNENITGGTIVGGFVGYNYFSVIDSSYSTGSVTNGVQDVGGLIGVNESSLISNCYNNGSVSGSGVSIGGLVGNNYDSSEIDSCYSIGNVSGNGFVGGLIGINQYFSQINSSYHAASVNSSTGTSVGGLVGANEYSSQVNNSYSIGSVSGHGFDVGGLVGLNVHSSGINDCYSAGSVSSTASNVGGFTGYSDTLLINCFWDIQASGQSSSSGGTGEVTSAMKDPSTFFNAGWNQHIWKISDRINEGYPYLQWQSPAGTSLSVVVKTGEPEFFALSQNYPNPFNPSTVITYDVGHAARVRLTVFNELGQKVADLVDSNMQPGRYRVEWAPANLSSGIYYVRMTTQGFVATRKLLFMK
jgi:Secretion system C-terminal sorting domain/The GLUG motif